MNSKCEKEDICSHEGILDGTIENHECDPVMDCPECRGDGRCVECNGNGENTCNKCGGSGECTKCHGEGSKICHKCGGSGTCRRCGGSGLITCNKCSGRGTIRSNDKIVTCEKCHGRGSYACPDCSGAGKKLAKGLASMATLGAYGYRSGRGSGKCLECGGTGRITCSRCEGSGRCTNCHGKGLVTCDNCSGSGRCPKCSGSGKVTCTRCKGTGWYQTYKVYKANCYEIKYCYTSSDFFSKPMELATGEVLFMGLYKKWKSISALEYDKVTELKKIIADSYKSLEQYDAFEDNHLKVINECGIKDKYYSQSVCITKILISKVEFKINDNIYTLYILGKNGVVLYDELPVKIDMYKYTFFQSLILKFSKKSRHLAYIKLAAYIFQNNGGNLENSPLLTEFINALNYRESKVIKLKDTLKKLNSELSYSELRKKIKVLFSSKKTLTFVWQCLSVEKQQVTAKGEELFNNIANEYKNVDEEELKKLKDFASKYALLESDQLVKEYLS